MSVAVSRQNVFTPAVRFHTSTAAQATRASPFAFDLVTDVAAFKTLEPEWNALFEAAATSAHVFQTFAWTWHWCRHYLPPHTTSHPAIVTGRLAGRLVLICPLILERTWGLRQLAWMGDPVSQYGDVLALPEAGTGAAISAALQFAVRATRADVVLLRKVRADATVIPALSSGDARILSTEMAPCLDMRSLDSPEACDQLLAGKTRRNRRRHLRRLADRGPVEMITEASSPAAAVLARDAIAMKRAALEDKGEVARAYADDRFADFFAGIAAGQAPHVACRVSALRANGETAAVQLTLDCGRTRFLHITVYNRAFEKFGAGALLLEHDVRRSFDDGIRTYDLLAPLHPYKAEHANSMVAVHDYAIACTWTGRLYAALYLRARPRVKRMLQNLPSPLRRITAAAIMRHQR